MNNIKINIIVVVSSFFLLAIFGCTNTLEDAFDKSLTDEPINSFTPAQVFSSEQGVETAVNGMWSVLQSFPSFGSSFNLTMPHSGKIHSNQGNNRDATSLALANNNIFLINSWRSTYSSINIANLIILNLKDSDFSNRDSSLGQAYFVRAFLYYNLVRQFGEIPIRIEPSTSSNLNLAKSTKEEVFNLIFSDLKKATELLPARGEYIVGRPIKYAANGIMADTYMWLAGREQADPTYIDESTLTEVNSINFWEEARDQLDIVINEGGYELVPIYSDLFADGVENTLESIFELQYGFTGDGRESALIRDVSLRNGPNVPTGSQAFSRIKPNKEVFSNHIIQYSGIDFSGQEFIPAGTASDIITLDPTIADPRIDATYIYNSYIQTNNNRPRNLFPRQSGRNNFARAFFNKYPDQSYNSVNQTTNHIMLRYADILLRRAEVENEITGPDNAFQYINQVLARARNTSSGTTVEPADWNATTIISKEDFRDRIMKERDYELIGEFQEWFDVRRRGVQHFVEQMEFHNRAVVFYNSTGGNSGDYIFQNIASQMTMPIPLSEISTNNLINE